MSLFNRPFSPTPYASADTIAKRREEAIQLAGQARAKEFDEDIYRRKQQDMCLCIYQVFNGRIPSDLDQEEISEMLWVLAELRSKRILPNPKRSLFNGDL